MDILVDLDDTLVSLSDIDDLGRLAVKVVAPLAAAPLTEKGLLERLLDAKGVGRLDNIGNAFIRPLAIEQLLDGTVGPDWSERFAKMQEYALSRGWVDSTDGSLQVHVVWPNKSTSG